MKVGDRVRVINNGSSMVGKEATVRSILFEDGVSILLDEDVGQLGADEGAHNMYFYNEELEVIQ